MRAPFLLAVVLSCSLAVNAQSASQGCAASHYKIVALPLQPVHINNSGVIAGTTARIDEDHKPALWTEKDGLRIIDLPEGFSGAEPHAINSSGEIVGTASRQGSQLPYAFKYQDGKFSLLTEEHAKAMAVSDSGDIGGQVGERLTVWSHGKAVSLGGCCGGIVHAMNDREVLGQVNDKDGHYGAFVWDQSQGLHSIAPAHAANSIARTFNQSGHILLQSFTPNEISILREGKTIPVKLSAEYASQPLGFNDCDVVVGEFGASSEWNHAFIWDDKAGLRDLNALIDAGSQWTLESALDINDRGEIIGVGDRGGEQDIGFLLVPDSQAIHKVHEAARR
jgi:probable HAF family extracellular repeat protein